MHLFLTGGKRVGKSTLLRALLSEETRRLGGFLTVRSEAVFPGRVSLHLLRAGSDEQPSEENFLLFCRPRVTEGCEERFARLGCAALSDPRAELLVMDELGPAECEAAAFQEAVLRALDGAIPVVGVLQRAEAPFLRALAARPDVRLVTVTEENRDGLLRTLRALLP